MTTKMGRALTIQFRATLLALRAEALKELPAIWQGLDPNDLDGSWAQVEPSVLAMISRKRIRAATIAANYYRLFRSAEGMIEGNIAPADAIYNSDWIDAALISLQVTGPISVKRGFSMKRRPKEAMDTAFVLFSGAVTRIIMAAGRESFVAHVAADNAE